jgi:large subunit ribosomal protein L17
MRHLKTGRRLGRSSAHRKALFRNLVTALIMRERIRTTLAKAKEMRSKIEKTITLGKKGTLHARRLAFKTVSQKDALQKLFGPLSERYAERKGGYTRIIKIGNRRGDDAPMAFIELVDREEDTAAPTVEVKETKKEGKAKKPATEAKETTEKKPKAKKAPAKKKVKDAEDKKEEAKPEKKKPKAEKKEKK